MSYIYIDKYIFLPEAFKTNDESIFHLTGNTTVPTRPTRQRDTTGKHVQIQQRKHGTYLALIRLMNFNVGAPTWNPFLNIFSFG